MPGMPEGSGIAPGVGAPPPGAGTPPPSAGDSEGPVLEALQTLTTFLAAQKESGNPKANDIGNKLQALIASIGGGAPETQGPTGGTVAPAAVPPGPAQRPDMAGPGAVPAGPSL